MDDARAIPSDHLAPVTKLLRRSFRHLWVLALAAIVGTGGAYAFNKLRHPRYQSQAVLYYQEGLSWTLSGGEGVSGRRIGARLKEMLLARSRLQKVIEDLKLYPKLVADGKMAEAVEEIHNDVTFRVNEGETFVISYSGASPEEAQEVTAKLTETLIGENTRLRAEQAEVAKGFLDAEKKRNEENLRDKETMLARFLAKHPEFAQEQSGTQSGAAVRSANRKPTDTPPVTGGDAVLTALRREEDRLRHQIASPNEVQVRPKDPALLAAKSDAEAKLAAAKRDLADKKLRFTEQHPDVRAAELAVRDAEASLARAVDALKGVDSTAPDVIEIEPKAALEARLAQVEQEIRDYQKKHAAGSGKPDEVPEANDAAQRIVGLETDWARLNREVAEARERFQQLDTRQFLATMAASQLTSGQAAQIIVIDPAYLPSRPVGMSNGRFLMVGAAAALGLGIGLALLMGFLDDRVLDRADIESLAIAPVLIEVPLGRKGGKRG